MYIYIYMYICMVDKVDDLSWGSNLVSNWGDFILFDLISSICLFVMVLYSCIALYCVVFYCILYYYCVNIYIYIYLHTCIHICESKNR